jgi:hypothetical protein
MAPKKLPVARSVVTGAAVATRTDRTRDLSASGFRLYLQFERFLVHCPRCRGVYGERLDWLAKNPHFTQRFALYVGALWREMTNTAVAKAESLHDSMGKNLDSIYMQQLVDRATGERRGRDGHPEGARLPHRRQRSRPKAANLGRRYGLHRGRQGSLLCRAGQVEALVRRRPSKGLPSEFYLCLRGAYEM